MSGLAGVGQAQRGSAGRDFSACTPWDEEGKGRAGVPSRELSIPGAVGEEGFVGAGGVLGWERLEMQSWNSVSYGCFLSVLLPSSS